ncbi:type II secretion system protein N [Comamonas composti]|uniref:type II secretion system protein N n=1 Tax=Comamonas composti TaxID=408558 RepID=UPI000414E272|nr:type II secretion system protein N [Comamonas composti]
MTSRRLPRPHEATARSPRGWALAGACAGLLASAVIWAPASWLGHAIERATQGQVLLQQAQGTLWNGSAALVLTGGAGSRDRAGLPTRLQWQLQPHLTGARLKLQSACCTLSGPVQMDIRPGWQALSLRVGDSDSRWPATLLAGLGTPWNTLDLQGQLRLAPQDWQLHWRAGRWSSQGRLRLEALAVSSRLSPLRLLGSYRLDIEGGSSPRLLLSTQSGDLLLNGQGQWTGQRLHFQGEASSSPEREAALSNLLNILGRRQGARSIITFG